MPLRHRQEGRTDVFADVDTTDFTKVIFFYKSVGCCSYVQHGKSCRTATTSGSDAISSRRIQP